MASVKVIAPPAPMSVIPGRFSVNRMLCLDMQRTNTWRELQRFLDLRGILSLGLSSHSSSHIFSRSCSNAPPSLRTRSLSVEVWIRWGSKLDE